jgi:hypothetical protein
MTPPTCFYVFFRIFYELIQISELSRLLCVEVVCTRKSRIFSPGHFSASVPQSQLYIKPATNCFTSESNLSLRSLTCERLQRRSTRDQQIGRAWCLSAYHIPFVRNNKTSLLYFPPIFTPLSLGAMKNSNSVVCCTQLMKTKQCSKDEIHTLHHITPGNLPLRRQRILAQHLESMTLLVCLLHCLGKFLLPRAEAFLHAQDQQTYLFHLRHRCLHAHLCAWATVACGWRRDVLHRGRKERCGGT